MIRTLATLAFLIVAVLLLPLAVQIALFLIALFVVSPKLFLFLPAVLSDVLYGEGGHLFPWMTLFVAAILIIHWVIFTKTRIGQMAYGVETY